MVGAQEEHQRKGGHGKADDDRRKNQRLRHGVGWDGREGVFAFGQDRCAALTQAACGKDEQVGPVAEEAEAEVDSIAESVPPSGLAQSSGADAAADVLAEKLRQAEMMMEYERQASASVSLTDTAEMTVSVVATDDHEIFEVWVQQGPDSWKLKKQWADCLALQEALAEQAKMMGVKVPKLGGFSMGVRKKPAAVAADRKKALEAFLKSAVQQLSMTNELNVFLERGMHRGPRDSGVAENAQQLAAHPVPTNASTADNVAPAGQGQEEPLDEARNITLLIKPNELVSSTRRMNVNVRSFSELLCTVGTDLGLGDGIALSSEADDTMQLTSLDQFGKKEKVQVWWVSKFEGFVVQVAAVDDTAAARTVNEAEEPRPAVEVPIGDVQGTSWTVGHDEEDGYYYFNQETEESVWEMPDEVAAALGHLTSREFSILMQKNDHLASNRKMVVTASSLEQLTEQVCENLSLAPSSAYELSVSGATEALESLDQLDSKAKLQIWPAGHF